MKDLSTLRQEYGSRQMNKSDMLGDPIKQFDLWFNEAEKAEIEEPNAMVLATVGVDYQPHTRVVLLKGFDENGFVFYTNYLSAKANEMTEQSKVSLLFFWQGLERQIRIEGEVKKVSDEESDAYFKSRPRESQLGAWASPQSQIIANRPVLESKYEELELAWKGKEIPRPAHWGGYIVRPSLFEFWQGRPSRLHDRMQYTFIDRKWAIERLAP